MKTKSFAALLFSAFLFATANAQIAVPQQVKSAFTKEHPGVTNAIWEHENGNFEGNWKVDGVDHSALYSPQGKFVMSETDIEITMLPEAARAYVAQKVHRKIKEASKNVDAKGTITYEADTKNIAYIFDENGKFVKTAEGD